MSKEALSNGFNRILSKAGNVIKVQYYTQTIGSVWDDEVALVQSGNDVWISGVVLPINKREGSTDSLLVEEGRLKMDDQRLFINGSIFLAENGGSGLRAKIQVGSPTGDKYELIPPGGIVASWGSDDIYKKSHIRFLTTGSFLGE